MNIVIILMASVAFLGVIGLSIALLIERSQRKRLEIVLGTKIDNLAKDVSREILEDKDQKFWPSVKKEIDEKVKGLFSSLLSKAFGIVLSMSSAEIKEFLAKFPGDRLIKNILKAIKEMHPSNSDDQEEEKSSTQ
jgi:hypothetical protein